jgi:hypothetical protein
MQPNLEAEQLHSQEQPERQIDLVSIYRTVLRVVAHLEGSDYNGEKLRQAEVYHHSDLPDPASRADNSQG